MAGNKEESVSDQSSQRAVKPASVAPGASKPLAARGRPQQMPIVAIGASAGGLEAASKLIDGLSPQSGMAFILVQHLDPTHKSLMVKLLAGHTAIKVVEAIDGSTLRPDHIYVIPPGRYLSVRAGAIQLSPQQTDQGARLPFDFLLASLAKNCGSRTIAVVLSGTGTDGSNGIAALKTAGGYVIAQDPAEADYDGMVRSAISTGLVDHVLLLSDIPSALAAHALGGTSNSEGSGDTPTPEPTGLNAIISFLKDKTPHDFRQYKPGTLERRVERRTALLSMERGNFTAYLDVLRKDPVELDLLAKDLLINVTSFFRDPAVFEALASKIIPEIVRDLPKEQALRIWVAACSTGEEAYSIAMICSEAIEQSGRGIKLQVFASDVDQDAIAIAREGLYPLEIADAVSADRLRQFFVKEDAGYRVTASLRDDLVFTVQDVLTDPPFSKIDMVSCRNLLIYLKREAQARLISLFHFALKESGILVLGSSETTGGADDRFEVISKSKRFYRHIAQNRIGDAGFPLRFAAAPLVLGNTDENAPEAQKSTHADICRTAVLASHAPSAILINRKRQCLYSIGAIERYLHMPQGYSTLDILAMAPLALRTKLRLAIDKVSKNSPRVDVGRTCFTNNGSTLWCNIDVQSVAGNDDDLLLICFTEEPAGNSAPATSPSRNDGATVAELEKELEATQAELQATIRLQEASAQEHEAINEEALSVNEEFQSTNEELLTSKEELQSLNEELTVLNTQLQETLERQRLTSDDLQNVLYSTDVGTLFLDSKLNIRFYTPAIRTLFNIISGDIGRPISDLKPIAEDGDILADAKLVIADEEAIEREISAPDDKWYLRRIFPYRAHDNRIEGVVVTFADITDRKIVAKALEVAKSEADHANIAKSRFLAAASHDLRQPLQSLFLLQELLAQSANGEKQEKLVARLGQTVGTMSSMLNALLDINQIEAGVVEAQPRQFPLAQVLDRLREEFADMALIGGLSLKILPTDAVVFSDPTLLEQIIRNLLGNAIKYTEEGKILIGCRHRSGKLRIEIWDTGIGIAEDQLNAIFDEFHQIDNFARERSRGLGLGLSIVKRLADLLGHEVDVRSRPGKGSAFSVNLAIVDQGQARPPTPVKKPVLQPDLPAHGNKIVIVDDDPDVLELLAELISGDGHIVRTATDAAAALRLITDGAVRPDILLTDYNLPGDRNGLELVAEVRKYLSNNLPAIVLTGDISSETLAKIVNEDCLKLSKPIKAHELRAAIEKINPQDNPQSTSRLPSDTETNASVTYLVDDDNSVRTNIREVLEADGRTVEDFDSAEAFLDCYRQGTEGCLLVDAYLPGISGVELIHKLRERGDHFPAILITGSSDVGLAVEAMKTGACDFIEKPVGRVELLECIARAIDQSRGIRLNDALHHEAAAHLADLTSRQLEIMDLVLAGHPSKNIAADLGISQRTVENHRAAVMRKMGAKSLPELARMALAATKASRETG
jgi:two-component system CheB/CheR fusion protein